MRTFCDPDVPGECFATTATSAGISSDPSDLPDTDVPDNEDGSTDTASDESGTEVEVTLAQLTAGPALPLEIIQNPDLAGQPLYDPNDPQSTAPFYNSNYWELLLEYYRKLYGDFGDDDWDEEDIEWCTCTASYAGYPPPPPWIDMTYRCWCSDPGAK
jgi:hypothetical protein